MSQSRAAGFAGLLVGAGGVLSVPLYFIYSGPPPLWDVLTRNLVTIVVAMALIVFLAGLRRALGSDWLTDVVYGAGVIYTAVILVGVSLEAGVAYGQPGADPTTTGPLADGDILIHGSIGRALTVVILGTAGYLIIRDRALPRWTGYLAYAIAAVNLACVPSLYFGHSASTFYSALGWGNTAATASLISYWVFAVGLVLARRRSPA
jgi:hypothetical protein